MNDPTKQPDRRKLLSDWADLLSQFDESTIEERPALEARAAELARQAAELIAQERGEAKPC